VSAAACGRSDLADELLIVGPGDDGGDFDVVVGDDGTVPEASTPDAARHHDAGVMDTGVPPPEDSGFEDATPPPDDGGECSFQTCATGCCYGNICAIGTQNIACGQGGTACLDCTTFGGTTCFNGACVALHP
jgi:hypothetical protein